MLEHHEKVFSKKGRKKGCTHLDERSIWVRILEYVGIIADDITPKPLTGDIEIFLTLYAKAKVQHLRSKQQRKFEQLIVYFTVIIYPMADVVACTSTQLSSKVFERVEFGHAMIDEAGIITEAQWTLVWNLQGLISIII